MDIQKLIPNFDKHSIQNRILKAHSLMGSHVSDVAMPSTVSIPSLDGDELTGALKELNGDQFRGSYKPCLGQYGAVIEFKQTDHCLRLKVAIPVYSIRYKHYQGMLLLNVATLGQEEFDDDQCLEVDPETLSNAVFDGDTYWLKELVPVSPAFELNPFDYAQAVLPKSLRLKNGEQIETSKLCSFLSEAFRFLEPCDRALFVEIMEVGQRFTRFLSHAASTSSHHGEDHGLLIHTAETVANVLVRALNTPKVDIDTAFDEGVGRKPQSTFDLSLTLLAALLHDASKALEYHRLAPHTYSSNLNCRLLGHEQTMLKWIAVASAVSASYPLERELQLEHAICAVKKQHDQSGARKRKTMESFVLHDADCDSARAYDKGQTSVLLAHGFISGEPV